MTTNDKKVKRFFRRLKIKKTTDPEVIKAKILYYAMGNEKLDKIALPDNLLNDSKFLRDLFSVNFDCTLHVSPGKELQKDVAFMAKYVEFNYHRIMKKDYFQEAIQYFRTRDDSVLVKDKSKLREKNFYWAVRDYRQLFINPKFTEALSNCLPELNVIKVLSDCLKPELSTQEYTKTMLNIPEELILKQTKIFGRRVLELLPKDRINRTLVDAGIMVDGFDSLAYLDINEVSKNKDLVIKAYEGSNAEELKNYIENTLNPNRNELTLCNGEVEIKKIYDEKFAKVQKELLADEKIKSILDNQYSRPHGEKDGLANENVKKV